MQGRIKWNQDLMLARGAKLANYHTIRAASLAQRDKAVRHKQTGRVGRVWYASTQTTHCDELVPNILENMSTPENKK